MSDAKLTPNRTLTAMAMRSDQWDLIVLALAHIRSITDTTDYSVDKLGRTFLCRRCIEAIDDIHSVLPEAGE